MVVTVVCSMLMLLVALVMRVEVVTSFEPLPLLTQVRTFIPVTVSLRLVSACVPGLQFGGDSMPESAETQVRVLSGLTPTSCPS